MSAYDHSVTYRKFKLRNIPHIIRLREILKLVKKHSIETTNYLDIGCSNGFITNILGDKLRAEKIAGMDHNVENIQIAKLKYPHISFDYINLNVRNQPSEQYSLISCFETLEHVGNLKTALNNLLDFCSPGATIIISVPIEIGTYGILKFLAKSVLFGYTLDELPGNPKRSPYLRRLLKGERISTFRDEREGWGTHFGFDYRDIDDIVFNVDAKVAAFNSFTTRFYIIKLKNNNQ